eukprot:4813277-Alexandrium_andersonii.AAC.1
MKPSLYRGRALNQLAGYEPQATLCNLAPVARRTKVRAWHTTTPNHGRSTMGPLTSRFEMLPVSITQSCAVASVRSRA